jgi:hypothetical protein
LTKPLGKRWSRNRRDEFSGTDGGGVLAAGAKDDGVVVDAHEASVADGNAMSVAAEVAIHLLGAAERALGVNDPALVVKPRAAAARGAVVEPVGEEAAGAHPFEAVHEFASEQRAEDVDRQQEIRRRADPGLAVGREPTAGDDAVGVGMKMQVARPGVQDGGDAKLGGRSEPFRIASEGQERVGGALEEQVEDERAVAPSELAQIARQREHDMEVMDWQDAVEPLLYPARAAQRLALGAMTIATGIVGRPLEAARRADLEVAAEDCGATGHHVSRDAVFHGAEDVLVPQGREVAAKDLGHLEPRLGVYDWRRARRTSGVFGHGPAFSRAYDRARSR